MRAYASTGNSDRVYGGARETCHFSVSQNISRGSRKNRKLEEASVPRLFPFPSQDDIARRTSESELRMRVPARRLVRLERRLRARRQSGRASPSATPHHPSAPNRRTWQPRQVVGPIVHNGYLSLVLPIPATLGPRNFRTTYSRAPSTPVHVIGGDTQGVVSRDAQCRRPFFSFARGDHTP